MTTRQREILDHVTISTPHLVGYYLIEGGLPFDFKDIYYRLTGRFDNASVGAVSFRRTLRTMERKGLLVRGSMLTDVAGCDQIECIREVATWHNPETFERDCRLMAALPPIADIKRQEVSPGTPRALIKTIFGTLKMVDNTWLQKPLVDWLDGKTPVIVLPKWVVLPQAGFASKVMLPATTTTRGKP